MKFQLRIKDDNFIVQLSNKLLDCKKDGTRPENYYITEKSYKSILKEAYVNGLTSFRDKGKVTVETKTSKNTNLTLLLELESETIKIIDVKYSHISVAKHSIFLTGFILQIPTKDQANLFHKKWLGSL